MQAGLHGPDGPPEAVGDCGESQIRPVLEDHDDSFVVIEDRESSERRERSDPAREARR